MYEEILALSPFGVAREKKQAMLKEELLRLTQYHRSHCTPYARMMETVGFSPAHIGRRGHPVFARSPVQGDGAAKRREGSSVQDHDLVGHDGAAGIEDFPRP